MKISKYTEACILCGLGIVFYPFIRLWFIIMECFQKEK
jgi:hypothetical protein